MSSLNSASCGTVSDHEAAHGMEGLSLICTQEEHFSKTLTSSKQFCQQVNILDTAAHPQTAPAARLKTTESSISLPPS